MAFTKTGRQLIKEAQAESGLLCRIGSGVGRTANPLLGAGLVGFSVTSGERSLGEAAGDTVGGMAGWSAGKRIGGKLIQSFFPNAGFWGRAASIAAGLVGSLGGSMAGKAVVGTALPFKRPSATHESYFR